MSDIFDAISLQFSQASHWLEVVGSEASNRIEQVANDMRQPHVLMKPKISIDGDQWCALYGENLQDGVAGFGDTPQQAMWNFDIAWLNQHALTRLGVKGE